MLYARAVWLAADDDQAATDIVLLLCEPDPAGARVEVLRRALAELADVADVFAALNADRPTASPSAHAPSPASSCSTANAA